MNYKLTIGWLYPDLMNIYGDRGNIITLQNRCQWRGINCQIMFINLESSSKDLLSCDLLMMGGAQDIQQEIVAKDLKKRKKYLSQMIEDFIPGLYVCGGFQFLGKYYKDANGNVVEQLGVLDMYTENPGRDRLIGNIVIKVNNLDIEFNNKHIAKDLIIVGFENHGGRTILGKEIKPFGKVLYGYGSSDEKKEEGAIYKNTIGTYFHGPILPKNPEIADWLIKKALEKKYKNKVILEKLDDSLEIKAREEMLKKLI